MRSNVRLTSHHRSEINEKEKNSEMLIYILSHIVEFRKSGESGRPVIHIHKLTETLLQETGAENRKVSSGWGYREPWIALASSLHDIGKIGVDEKILNKPGKLTKEEFEITENAYRLSVQKCRGTAWASSERATR